MKRKVAMIVSISIACVLLCAIFIYYFGASHKEFYSLNAKEEFGIPGLDTKFVPQGIEFDKTSNMFLVCGYMSDGTPSRIYVVDKLTQKTLKYVTLRVDGEDYTGHAGGIATDGKNLWLSGDKEVLTLNLSGVLDAETESPIEVDSRFITGNGCDWVTYYDQKLMVGEFYEKGDYETPEAHRTKTSNALAYVYEVDETRNTKIKDAPDFCISLPDNAQGLTICEDKIVVSASWAIPKSRIFVYDNVLAEAPTSTITLNKALPLYELGESSLQKSILAPSMSEELVAVDGRIYIMFESACNKWKMINRTRIKNVISIEI